MQLANGHPSASVAAPSKPPCAGARQQPRGRRKAAAAELAATACSHVGISIPLDRMLGFRALLGRLKKRAFRLESEHIRWASLP